MKQLIKLWLPPILLKIYRNLNLSGVRFLGMYSSWEEASLRTKGYDSEDIFERVKQSALKVKNGEAICERDSVLFDEPQYSWPSLACLMYVAACKQGNLSILDFGGSLGSSYFLNKKFLNSFNVEWSIVEQLHFVEFGKKEIADDVLKFYSNLDECFLERSPNCLFLSSVIQYLEDPYHWLEIFVNLEIDFILLDRMPFSKIHKEFIQIQDVPSSIYNASYPLHILNEEKIINLLVESGFVLIERFTPDVRAENNNFYTQGLFFKRLKP
jgi:putative methyltransferase (TIGR04325 family)